MDDIKILKRAETLSKGFSLQERFKHSNYPLHRHEYYEIEFIKSGGGIIKINNNEYVIKPNMLCFITPFDIQEIIIESPLNIINICFTESWISSSISNLVSSTIIYDFPSYILEELQYEYDNTLIFNDLYVRHMLNCCLIKCVRKSKLVHSDSLSPIIQNVLHYVQSHFTEDISIPTIAKNVGLTPNYLSSLFHSVFGQTLNDYITQLRVEHAGQLLSSTNDSITEICFASGFGSTSNFMRCFKNQYGITPRQFRTTFNNNIFEKPSYNPMVD